MAPQRRTALRAIVSKTGWTSAGELAITFRISALAACCSRASSRSFSASRRLAASASSVRRIAAISVPRVDVRSRAARAFGGFLLDTKRNRQLVRPKAIVCLLISAGAAAAPDTVGSVAQPHDQRAAGALSPAAHDEAERRATRAETRLLERRPLEDAGRDEDRRPQVAAGGGHPGREQ